MHLHNNEAAEAIGVWKRCRIERVPPQPSINYWCITHSLRIWSNSTKMPDNCEIVVDMSTTAMQVAMIEWLSQDGYTLGIVHHQQGWLVISAKNDCHCVGLTLADALIEAVLIAKESR